MQACAASTIADKTCVAASTATSNTPADRKASWTSEPVVVTATIHDYSAPDSASATRSATPLIEVAQSVQVLTRTLLSEQDSRTLADALANVSGVVASQPAENLFVAPIVRGFPAETYLDGLPLYGMGASNTPTSLVGIEQIEVLKGPTSTLYGGGLGSPLGGLINIVSARPESDADGFVAMRMGSYGTSNPYFDLTGPLTSKVNARLVGEYQSNDSWIDRVKGNRLSLQPSLSFQLGPQTELLLQGQFNRSRQLEYSGLPAAQALAGELDRRAFPGAASGQPFTRNESRLATVTLRHESSDALEWNVSGRYYDDKIPECGSFVYPGLYPPDAATPTLYPILPLRMMTRTKEGTFDANVLAKVDMLGGQHKLLAGVDYDRTHFSSNMGFDGVPIGQIDLAHPVYDIPFGAIPAFNLFQTDSYRTAAVYFQDQATYGRLHLTGSLRYTRLGFREVEQATDKTYSRVTPRIGATFDLVPGVAAYAGYATAFRAAFGYVGRQSPKPETSRNIEGGLKFALAKAGLSGTVAVFEQTRNNVATPDPENPIFSIQTGQQRARGVETDLIWEPVPAFSLMANYARTDAEVTRDNAIPVGDKLARVPKNSGRIAARYRVLRGAAKGLSFGAGVTALGARQNTLPNTVLVPGYAVFDAQAAYAFGRYAIEASVINLADRKAFDTYEYLSFPVVMPIQPRSVYLTLRVNL